MKKIAEFLITTPIFLLPLAQSKGKTRLVAPAFLVINHKSTGHCSHFTLITKLYLN
jgi:hypothetical protein